jgi:hypothetical protein
MCVCLQLGVGCRYCRTLSPTSASVLIGASTVVAGGRSTYALMPSGGIRAWGYNLFGQVRFVTSTILLTMLQQS